MDGSICGDLLLRPTHQTTLTDGAGGGITARLALNEEVLREAWSVRYAAYFSNGYIEPTATALFEDQYDYKDSSKTVVVYKNDAPVATVRVCLYAPDSGIPGAKTIPAMDVFYDEIVGLFRHSRLRNPLTRGAEVMRLSRHPDLRADYEPVFALFRMVGYLLLHFDADVVISAVRTHHVPFYRRMGFQQMTEPRPYPRLKFETGLMACARNDGQTLKDSLPVLGLVSKHDGSYADFLAGRRVPVFGTEYAPPPLSGMFGGRFEGTKTQTLRPPHARGRTRTQEVRAVA